MGIPDFCQMELELPALSGSCYQKQWRQNREQLLPAGILSFRLRVIQAAEQSFVFIVYRRQYQHDECQHGRLCTSHTLFVVDSHCRKIRQRMVHSICFRLGNRYQRAGRQGRKRRQSPQINSLRQRHIQAFPEWRISCPFLLQRYFPFA